MIRIANDRLTLELRPDRGAAVVSFAARLPHRPQPVPLFRSVSADTLTRDGAGAAAMFPMVPFANRLPGARLIGADGTIFEVPVNTDDPLPLHGTGWQQAWRVESTAPNRLVLVLAADGPAPGTAFSARLSFELTGNRLEIGQSVTNRSATACPMGMGLHPYVPRTDRTELRFQARDVWTEGGGHLPDAPADWPEPLDFRAGRPVDGTWRNNAYTGWAGQAEIRQPDLGYRLRMAASPIYGDLMLFVPTDGDCLALEPQTHTTGANDLTNPRADTMPMRSLAPGACLSGQVRLTVVPEDGAP